MARKLNEIIIHCSATPRTMDIGTKEIRQWHKKRGWRDIGYHYVIRRNGIVEAGRPVEQTGAHVKGRNRNSIGICLIGGYNKDNTTPSFTQKQYNSLFKLINKLRDKYDIDYAAVGGHRDTYPDKDGNGIISKNEWLKDCPCFDVRSWYIDYMNHTCSNCGKYSNKAE